MLWLRQGRPAPAPTIEQAEKVVAGLSGSELAVVQDAIARAIVGGPETVHAQLLDLVERTATDELMITSHVADAAVRARGLEHVARAFELERAAGRLRLALQRDAAKAAARRRPDKWPRLRGERFDGTPLAEQHLKLLPRAQRLFASKSDHLRSMFSDRRQLGQSVLNPAVARTMISHPAAATLESDSTYPAWQYSLPHTVVAPGGERCRRGLPERSGPISGGTRPWPCPGRPRRNRRAHPRASAPASRRVQGVLVRESPANVMCRDAESLRRLVDRFPGLRVAPRSPRC